MSPAKSGRGRALTRRFKGLVQRQIAADPAFAEALLCESVGTMLGGAVETGMALLADYIEATLGFEALGTGTGHRPAVLIRMFGPDGKPRARALLGVLAYLQKRAGLRVHVTARPGSNPGRIFLSPEIPPSARP